MLIEKKYMDIMIRILLNLNLISIIYMNFMKCQKRLKNVGHFLIQVEDLLKFIEIQKERIKIPYR